MYVLCWSNTEESDWEIFDTKEEIEIRIKELMDKDGCSNEDMMVFVNVDYVVPGEDGTID